MSPFKIFYGHWKNKDFRFKLHLETEMKKLFESRKVNWHGNSRPRRKNNIHKSTIHTV